MSETTPSQPAQREATHFYILTLQGQTRPGAVYVSTFSAAITPPDGWCRAELYRAIYTDLIRTHPDLEGGAQTLFFSLERNQL
ncbi:hypothetical protein [Streptomyces formicae]|uniref:Uncharacterized protein n=1 Tax=Streptomyces formicae TaxID=1616117 RepID=A0ABY3WTG4_9ACTN|nr:hypothetical protein [Streptomyces formicae]UNM13791.1 hypothetical protein J4032_22100 [Streptomyces formicae]